MKEKAENNQSEELAIQYIKGDATVPSTSGPCIIAHVCNNIGRWGKGFVLAIISKRWKQPEKRFRTWFQKGLEAGNQFRLGSVQVVQVTDHIYIVNMIGQSGIYPKNGVAPIRYNALQRCLEKLAKTSIQLKASVHIPRIGCGLAGGKWDVVQNSINRILIKQGIQVCVYDYF